MKYSIFILLFFTSAVFSQSSDFTDYYTARYAKAIGLGNAYTGYAEGIEAIYFNPAGLANINSYEFIYSKHDGLAWFVKMNNNDIAIMVPISEKIGNIALSRNQILFDSDLSDSYSHIYSLVYAGKLRGSISAGININYFHYHFKNTQPVIIGEEAITNIKLFDIGLSVLYRHKQINLTDWDDSFGFGFFFNNLLDSKYEYSDGTKEEKAQFLRAGISYSFTPLSKRIYNLEAMNLVFNFDGSFLLKNYTFYLGQPNYGIQMTLLEYLALRFGRQSEFLIKEYYSNSPQYPVNRFGIGVILPVSELLVIDKSLRFFFDFTYSDWNQIDENTERNFLGLGKINRKSYSFRIKLIL